MRKARKVFSVVFTFVFAMFILLSSAPAKAEVKKTVIPEVQFASAPVTEYTAGDRVQFNIITPNYGGKVEYRVVLWDDSNKSYSDLWNEKNGYPNRYYTKWQSTGNTVFTLGWPITEPGNYRITVYVKRVGIASSKAALTGMNCDSYKQSAAFTVKPKKTSTIGVVIKGRNVVSDSIVKLDSLSIKMPSNIREIEVSVYKNGECKDQYIDISDGIVGKKIYLPFGSGKYNMEIGCVTSKTVYNDVTSRTLESLDEMEVENTDVRDLKFLLPTDSVESDDPEIIKLANDITNGLQTDYEKTLAIHDWVATNIAYDVEAYFSGNVHIYSALDTLHGKKAICNGYANLTAALNRAIVIKTKIVSGIAIWNSVGETWENTSKKEPNHAWNETYIDGKWVVQDTTWDAGYTNVDEQDFIFHLTHKYFNPSLGDFAMDHRNVSEEE